MFPSDNHFLQPTGAASNGIFDTDSSGMSGISGMPRGGHGGGGGAGGPGLNVKSSVFDVHVGMSMKDMMGGGGASTGTGGLRTPGSEGRGAGAGPKLSLGLRF
jgi:hypothetical protein